ncbi:hypothetical protein MAHJHV58_39610 [Mycobacterium avium subsp. hominissuis]|uniref:hypothetical protein n=1 Tax=Mycobacterium avium TaxID=1764 RepID=UPI000BAFA72F|nr:hypothetical protein [Mycobacterium avium]PBA38805.1 hypothetical protein CKJ63_25420 [Mycobacterium avium]PBA78716.1 hypothetical protein CKJ72_25460 [Mycobacterium avium]
MTTTWDHIDHDPTSIASIAAEPRPTIRMRHMSMSCGGGFADRPAGRTFRCIDDANMALIELALANAHAMGAVIIEPDPLSPVSGAYHVIIHWGTTSDRYHLDTIDHALPGEL